MSFLAWVGIGAACLVMAASLSLLFVYNRLALLRRRCEQAFADIDVQVRNRHDLIPSLVETVRSFAGHEKAIVDNVLKARTEALRAAGPDRKVEAESALTISLSKLIAVAESYPGIAAGSHYADLRSEIVDVNNKIAAARRFFNLAVGEYNGARDQFPANLIARRFALEEKRAYSLGLERAFVEEPPEVRI